MSTSSEFIRRVGLIANTDKPHCRNDVRKTAALIADTGREVVTDVATGMFAGFESCKTLTLQELIRSVDLLAVFGGDGTMLRVARETGGCGTPILGINVGGLGFLTVASSERIPEVFEALWGGAFALESRPLIEARGTAVGHPIHQIALNDLVVSRGAVPRLIDLAVRVDDVVLTHYRCDGLIVSSPTGSTAYSLAAGGAVVSPDAEVLALTPICPHALSNRSVIVSLKSIVEVTVAGENIEAVLSADGQVQTALTSGDRVRMCRSHLSIKLVRLAGMSFFETLRQKFQWSGSTV